MPETLDLNTDEHSVAAWIALSLKRRGVARAAAGAYTAGGNSDCSRR